MKKIAILILLLVSLNCFCQNYTLLEINARWNSENNIPYKELANVKIGFAWLEDQPEEIQKSVVSVPTLVLMRNGRPVHQWQAGIDLKLHIKEEDIKSVIDKLNNRQ